MIALVLSLTVLCWVGFCLLCVMGEGGDKEYHEMGTKGFDITKYL